MAWTWRALATLPVAVAALAGGGSALAAGTPPPIGQSSLYSIATASGSLTGSGDQHLTLRLTGTRGYLIRFTDRPLPRAFAVRNADFARQFTRDFASSRAKAVLTYTRPGGRIPVSLGLTIAEPRWDAHHHTWEFGATRTRTKTDSSAGAVIHVKPRRVHSLRTFTHPTLLIDDSQNCDGGVVRPYEDCTNADLAFVNLSGDDLTGVNFSGANLTGANLTGANLTGANLTYSGLTGSDLTGADLSGDNLSGQIFIGSDLHDAVLTGADLTGVVLPGVNLTGANLSGANLTNANLTGADLIDADVTNADVYGADFRGARFCGAILPQGNIGGGC